MHCHGPSSQSLVLVPILVIGEAVGTHARPGSHLAKAFVACPTACHIRESSANSGSVSGVDVLDVTVGGV